MDAIYVFRGDFRLCCQRIAVEYVDAFSKPLMTMGSAIRVVTFWQKSSVGWIKANSYGAVHSSDACALVETISSLLNRSWSVRVQHIPREKNLVADRIAAMCRSDPIGMLEFADARVDLVVLANKKANND
ncbi:hypothetical protein V6N12_059408 [Hibiscus sabdariffa]|uniref:RNase H type-1 domain-containing protein n=1 Tax=Hibiscus sabdariffa TaxID=183260 RepID=A0ABR2EXJ1_9ROSI